MEGKKKKNCEERKERACGGKGTQGGLHEASVSNSNEGIPEGFRSEVSQVIQVAGFSPEDGFLDHLVGQWEPVSRRPG